MADAFDDSPIGVAFTDLEVHTRRVFRCAQCGESYYWQRYGYQLHRADGLMVCRACAQQLLFRYWRCSRCDELCPPWRPKAKAPHRGGTGFHSWCEDCDGGSRYTPVTPVERRCAECGQPFTAKRRDARYCSGRCRVAAHRAGPAR